MRDPERIDKIIYELRELWKIVPDWRLGQLVFNLQRNKNDLFYIEDDEMEEMIKSYYNFYKSLYEKEKSNE